MWLTGVVGLFPWWFETTSIGVTPSCVISYYEYISLTEVGAKQKAYDSRILSKMNTDLLIKTPVQFSQPYVFTCLMFYIFQGLLHLSLHFLFRSSSLVFLHVLNHFLFLIHHNSLLQTSKTIFFCVLEFLSPLPRQLAHFFYNWLTEWLFSS